MSLGSYKIMKKYLLEDYRQNIYNFFSPSIVFILLWVGIYFLLTKGIIQFAGLGVIDILIIALASARLIRLVSFDSMFQFVRDFIGYKKKVVEENGMRMVVLTPVGFGTRRLLSTLIDCVWCIGVWTSVVALLLYMAHPITTIITIVLAIATIGTGVQILISLIANKKEQIEYKNDKEMAIDNMNKGGHGEVIDTGHKCVSCGR